MGYVLDFSVVHERLPELLLFTGLELSRFSKAISWRMTLHRAMWDGWCASHRRTMGISLEATIEENWLW
jgi:hypothetical protein